MWGGLCCGVQPICLDTPGRPFRELAFGCLLFLYFAVELIEPGVGDPEFSLAPLILLRYAVRGAFPLLLEI